MCAVRDGVLKRCRKTGKFTEERLNVKMSDMDSTRSKKTAGIQFPPAKELKSLARTAALINDFGKSSITAQILRQQAINTSLKGVLGLNSPSMKAIEQLAKLASRDINVPIAALAAHPSWDSELKHISAQFSKTESSWRSAMNGISRSVALSASRDSSVSAQVTHQITAGMLADNLKIEQSVASSIRRSLTGFEKTYANLVQSFKGIEDLARRPAFVLPGATCEVVATGRVMESLLPSLNPPFTPESEFEDGFEPDDAGEDWELMQLLERINPKFAEVYSGALKALESDNPERPRHVLTSLRELANHLLRELAPPDPLEKWIDSRGDADLRNRGKPTRRAKIIYIMREVDDKPLTKFVATDAGVIVKLFELYDRLHELEMNLTDKQLRAIVLRSESYWRFVLRVRES